MGKSQRERTETRRPPVIPFYHTNLGLTQLAFGRGHKESSGRTTTFTGSPS
jgi:hypothetical protein